MMSYDRGYWLMTRELWRNEPRLRYPLIAGKLISVDQNRFAYNATAVRQWHHNHNGVPNSVSFPVARVNDLMCYQVPAKLQWFFVVLVHGPKTRCVPASSSSSSSFPSSWPAPSSEIIVTLQSTTGKSEYFCIKFDETSNMFSLRLVRGNISSRDHTLCFSCPLFVNKSIPPDIISVTLSPDTRVPGSSSSARLVWASPASQMFSLVGIKITSESL